MIENSKKLSEELKKQAIEKGFHPVGIAAIPGSSRIKMRTKSLERWLKAGNNANMQWMNSTARKDPEQLLEGVKSVLVVGLNYFTIPTTNNPNRLLIGRYAWGNDYHKVINKRLKQIGEWLTTQRPSSKWKICVDSHPLLEKAWAEEAGIGWIGKNSNLINPKQGSWMVLGNLLSTEELLPDKPSVPLCGKCQECIKGCPTNAIVEPFVIDARKCIAFHNIENREKEFPLAIQKSIGQWVAGCDICQEECPWNKKDIPISRDPDVKAKDWIMNITVEEASNWNDEYWQKLLKGSSLKRIKPWMWRRNVNYILKHNSSKNLNKKNEK